ncbi:MAG: PTS system mannose/fructose/sorbose family transporter subunit IID [Gemmatimonadota bacterium]
MSGGGLTVVRTVLRSLLIQGSWNTRTQIGNGFAWALAPVLRRVYAQNPDALEAAVTRHAAPFNAHPYLAALALAAVARMEEEGEPSERIERFKTALRGPLGALGDRLIWARWLPLSLLCASAAALRGAPWWAVAAGFLVLYNAGHLALRIWAARTGWQAGKDVGTRLRAADLSRWSGRLGLPTAVASGVLLGAILGLALGGAATLWFPGVAVAALFALGVFVGERGARTGARLAALVILMLSLVGWLS